MSRPSGVVGREDRPPLSLVQDLPRTRRRGHRRYRPVRLERYMFSSRYRSGDFLDRE